ncbi:MAG: AGE family epimerase/isomerase, partial [Pseudomonadota bacterium]
MHQSIRRLLRRSLNTCAVLSVFALTAAGVATHAWAEDKVAGTASMAQAEAPIAALPSGSQWINHVQQDLLPFWDMPDAWGTPRGNFPTFRCNNGKRYDAKSNPCLEIGAAPGWIKDGLQRDYVRMKARQTYAYGVAYHLTGEPKMLALARDGVNYLRSNGLDKTSGSAVTYWENGKPMPAVLARNTQDLAYAQLGLAMYYNLTRDEAVLADILRLKNHIFENYYNADWGMLMWVKKDDGDGEAGRQELVAQLDQINAYMLLLTPILPADEQEKWRQDLRKLANI